MAFTLLSSPGQLLRGQGSAATASARLGSSARRLHTLALKPLPAVRSLQLCAKGKKAPAPAPPPPPEPEDDGDDNDEDGDESGMWGLLIGVEVGDVKKLPAGATHKSLIKDVEELVKKAVGKMLPTNKQMEESGMDKGEQLIISSSFEENEKEKDQAFDPEDDTLMIDLLFLEEEQAEKAAEKILAALANKGLEGEVLDYDDDEFDGEDEDEEGEEEEDEDAIEEPARKPAKK